MPGPRFGARHREPEGVGASGGVPDAPPPARGEAGQPTLRRDYSSPAEGAQGAGAVERRPFDGLQGLVYNPPQMRGLDKDRLFDKRTVRRNIANGRVEKDDYQHYLQALPDLRQQVMARDEGGDNDGFEQRFEPSSEGQARAAQPTAEQAPAVAGAPAPTEVAQPAPAEAPGVPGIAPETQPTTTPGFAATPSGPAPSETPAAPAPFGAEGSTSAPPPPAPEPSPAAAEPGPGSEAEPGSDEPSSGGVA